MAITTSNDPIIIEVVETHVSSIPGEDELTETLKNQTARMLETCFDQRRDDVLQAATQTLTESVIHLHKLLCLQKGVHHSQLTEESIASENADEIDNKREQVNDMVDQHIHRQVRRFITFVGG